MAKIRGNLASQIIAFFRSHADEHGRVKEPQRLVSAYICTKGSLYRYIRIFEEQHLITVERTPEGGIIAIVFATRENTEAQRLVETRKTETTIVQPKFVEPVATQETVVVAKPPEPVAQPLPVATSQANGIAQPTVVLVDFDNLEFSARDAGFTVAYDRLHDHLRTYGSLLFLDAFISPMSKHEDTINVMNQAGFSTIYCPFVRKDRDGVDNAIMKRALAHLYLHPTVTVVIVSRDRDFAELVGKAKDLGRTLVLLDPLTIRKEIEGDNVITKLDNSRSRGHFLSAIASIENGTRPRNQFERDIQTFVSAIMTNVYTREERNPESHVSFHFLSRYAWQGLRERWENQFSEGNLKDAIGALVDCGILEVKKQGVTNNYVLRREHRLVIRLCGLQHKNGAETHTKNTQTSGTTSGLIEQR